MKELLIHFLDQELILKDQAVIQISSYDMDYFEYFFAGGQVLIYRSHNTPILTKVIIIKDKSEFNHSLPADDIKLSHFLEYYLSLQKLSSLQLRLITGRIEEISYYLREQALFYEMDRPENVRLINILPQDLKQALRDYELLSSLIRLHSEEVIIKLFLALNINTQSEYEFLQELADSYKLRI